MKTKFPTSSLIVAFTGLILSSCIGLNLEPSVSDSTEIQTSSEENTLGPGYDIILVIGQSNTHFGWIVDPSLDQVSNPRIDQLGRHGDDNLKIIPGIEPLHHHTSSPYHIGFALTLAREYIKDIPGDRQILMIAGGWGATGLGSGHWKKGDPLYEDAVERTNFALSNYPNSRLSMILWHQGEHDVFNPSYQEQLDQMIYSFREDIHGDQTRAPFLLGGLVEKWKETNPVYQLTEDIIADTINRVPFTAFASSQFLEHTTFEDADESNDDIIHFSAEAQRTFGMRYYQQIQNAVDNEF